MSQIAGGGTLPLAELPGPAVALPPRLAAELRAIVERFPRHAALKTILAARGVPLQAGATVRPVACFGELGLTGGELRAPRVDLLLLGVDLGRGHERVGHAADAEHHLLPA